MTLRSPTQGFQPCVKPALVLVAMLTTSATARAQALSQRGFVEPRLFAYAQAAPGDAERAAGDVLLRYEPSWGALSWLRVSGSFDARAGTHDQVERRWRVDWSDRGAQRPALSIRRLDARLTRGKASVDLGKQFIRWGKADILNPTDRFAPRDFLTVVHDELLAVTAARATYGGTTNTWDVVWVPRFTPSRIPLLTRRWTVFPPEATPALVVDRGAQFPTRSQYGARYSRVGAGYELSVAAYAGFNHLPSFDVSLDPAARLTVGVRRVYPKMRMLGVDGALPLRWATIKGEAGFFKTSVTSGAASIEGEHISRSDRYLLYVVQLERQAGEWSLVGGYAGETHAASSTVGASMTANVQPTPGAVADFAADRGLTRAFLGRASYTIDTNRSATIEGAVRQNGRGVWLRGEFSRAAGPHWRATVNAVVIRGRTADFLGQYRRNSHATLTLRYSF